MSRFFLYLITVSYLKPSQWAHFAKRALLPTTKIKEKAIRVRRRVGIQIKPTLAWSMPSKEPYEFRFLNRSKVFSDERVDWHCQDMPKLWRYNLHYFDYICDTALPPSVAAYLLTDWITRCPQGTKEAWEPYTVSLRIINWVKAFLQKMSPQEVWLESLYLQALWLEQNIEYHFLANHYLKNGVALFFAGMFFKGRDAERWLRKGLKILREEIDEQFLSDGGHFERSPMYHSISVVDYVDILNLMISSSPTILFAEIDLFKMRTFQALDFLHDICLPDGEIPLLNDSAFKIAPSPSRIFEYARQITGYESPEQATDLVCREKADSGYYVLRMRDDMMIIDCGPIGPDYNPAHAHCDTLSYELSLNGRRVIVDSGVHDYEPGSERAYARSTKAHNTVVVDGQEQSEIWGVFRVARRAKPLFARLTDSSDAQLQFVGAHDGYTRLSGKVIHQRAIAFDSSSSSWIVTDEVQGEGTHRVDSYVHLHPDYTATQTGQTVLASDQFGVPILRIEIVSAGGMKVEQGWYFPEFGVKRENSVIVFTRTETLPLSLIYRITKVEESI